MIFVSSVVFLMLMLPTHGQSNIDCEISEDQTSTVLVPGECHIVGAMPICDVKVAVDYNDIAVVRRALDACYKASYGQHCRFEATIQKRLKYAGRWQSTWPTRRCIVRQPVQMLGEYELVNGFKF